MASSDVTKSSTDPLKSSTVTVKFSTDAAKSLSGTGVSCTDTARALLRLEMSRAQALKRPQNLKCAARDSCYENRVPDGLIVSPEKKTAFQTARS